MENCRSDVLELVREEDWAQVGTQYMGSSSGTEEWVGAAAGAAGTRKGGRMSVLPALNSVVGLSPPLQQTA